MNHIITPRHLTTIDEIEDFLIKQSGETEELKTELIFTVDLHLCKTLLDKYFPLESFWTNKILI